MKTLSLIFSILCILLLQITAQADKIAGFWLTEEEDAQVKIFKATNGKYYGQIVWLDEPNEEDGSPKVDDENPDPSLQNRTILELQLLKSFEYNAKDKEWEDGTIYDPDSGNTYDCYMWFEDDPNILKIKGYVLGMRFLGRSTTWKKETTQRNN